MPYSSIESCNCLHPANLVQEYYLCIQTQRMGCDISFSEAGGVEIEANWDKVKKITIPTLKEPSTSNLSPLLSGLPLELKEKMVHFIRGCFQVSSKIPICPIAALLKTLGQIPHMIAISTESLTSDR